MTTANTLPNMAAQQRMDQGLDAIDRALLGLLPRNDRLAVVAQVETRIRELAAASPAAEAHLTGSTEGMAIPDPMDFGMPAWTASHNTMPQAFVPSAFGWLPSTCRKQSRLALSAGVLGILALVLLFVTPVMYLLAGFLGDALGEIAIYSILGTHVAVVTLGGAAAVALAIAALVSLKRSKESLTGHAWAITGLCTGPLPMFAGGATALFIGFQLLASQTMSVQAASADETAPLYGSDNANEYPPPDPPAPTRGRRSDIEPTTAGSRDPDAGPGQPQVPPACDELPADQITRPDTGAGELSPLPPNSRVISPSSLPPRTEPFPPSEPQSVPQPQPAPDRVPPFEYEPTVPRSDEAC